MKIVVLTLALLAASPSYAFDLRDLKEIVPPAQVAKAKKQAKQKAQVYLKKQQPMLKKQGAVLKKKLAEKLKI